MSVWFQGVPVPGAHRRVLQNHTDQWSHKHGAFPPWHLDPVMTIARSITRFAHSLYDVSVQNCVGMCPGQAELCKGSYLLEDLGKLWNRCVVGMWRVADRTRGLNVSGPPLRMLGGVRQVISDLSEWITGILEFDIMWATEGPDCSDPYLHMATAMVVLAKVNLKAEVALSKLYFIAASRAVPPPEQFSNAVRFFDIGGSCFTELSTDCNRKIEVAKAILHACDHPFVVEIGVNLGTFGIGLVSALATATIVAVDPYDCSRDCYPYTDVAYDIVHNLSSPFRDRYHLIRQTSANVSKWVANGTFDLVFIDGDHTYEGCHLDVQHWVPKLKAGGKVMFHDYSLLYPGVTQCCHEAWQQWAVGPPQVAIHDLLFFEV